MIGPDLSNNNGTPNYPLLHSAKLPFIIHKATEGTGFHDKLFPVLRDFCARWGLPFGAYHFAGPTDPIAEATYFMEYLGKLKFTEIRPVLDYERGKPDRGWILKFCNHVEEHLKVKPLLYSNGYYAHSIGGWPAENLWIADLVPAGKSRIPNALHQYTWHGRISGVSGEVDLNYTNNLRNLLVFPKPLLTENEKWFLFARWWLGEGEFEKFGKHNKEHKPKELPVPIPPTWWARLVRFLARRKKATPTQAELDTAERMFHTVIPFGHRG